MGNLVEVASERNDGTKDGGRSGALGGRFQLDAKYAQQTCAAQHGCMGVSFLKDPLFGWVKKDTKRKNQPFSGGAGGGGLLAGHCLAPPQYTF